MNRPLPSRDEPEYRHPLTLGVCEGCGVVQLRDAPPPEEIRPRYDWIIYNEPEFHLDSMVDTIVSDQLDLDSDAEIWGISYKDESTLRRLRERGYPNTRSLRKKEDLGIEEPLGAVEAIQEALTPEKSAELRESFGRPDLVIFRHIVEHSHDIHLVMKSLHDLVNPGGYVVFEVPDSVRALDCLDYSMVWDEHTFAFTPETLGMALEFGGFEVVFLHSYPSTHENSLVAIGKAVESPKTDGLSPADLKTEVARARRFVASHPEAKRERRAFFSKVVEEEGAVALLGAGHLAAAFLNLFDVAEFFTIAVDDNPEKQGLFMPGSRIPIVPSTQLIEKNIRLCLMTVRPEVEKRVLENNREFCEGGGRLGSIFPESDYSIFKEAGLNPKIRRGNA